jgi:hypothetical protein
MLTSPVMLPSRYSPGCEPLPLSSTATQTSQTINFGNVLRGATIPSQNFTIYNLAANTSAAYTTNLKLTTGFTTTGDGALTTNLAPFNGKRAMAPPALLH